MFEYRVRIRLDEEEVFCTDSYIIKHNSTILSLVAADVEQSLGGHSTLISLERIV